MTTLVLIGTIALADGHDVHDGMIDFLNNFGTDIIVHGSKKAQAKYENYLPNALFESLETEMAAADEGDILITSQAGTIQEAIDKGYIVLFKGDNYKVAVDRLKTDNAEKTWLKKQVSTKFRQGKVTVSNSIPSIMMTLTNGSSERVEEKEEVCKKLSDNEDMRADSGHAA